MSICFLTSSYCLPVWELWTWQYPRCSLMLFERLAGSLLHHEQLPMNLILI